MTETYIYIYHYFFTLQPQCDAKFSFYKQTCLLCFVMQPLDFEAQQEYILILMVENLNPLSSKAPNLPVSTATVVVTIVNENEAPHFRESPIQIVVPESVTPGTLLKSNIAFDPDNSELRYDAATEHEESLCVFKNATMLDSLCD